MRNKRKGILMASAILGSAAIVSTGFAAWVITVEASAEASGQIDVDTVSDERITLTATDFSAAVKFGTKSTEGFANPWLTIRNAANENLVVTTTMTVSGGSYLDTSNPFNVTLVETSSDLYSSAASAGYVAPLSTVESNVDVVLNPEKTSATITVTFAWGGYFGEVNPTDFYNSFDYNDLRKDIPSVDDDDTNKLDESKVTNKGSSTTLTMADDAAAVLAGSGVFGALSNATFKLTIAPNRKTSA